MTNPKWEQITPNSSVANQSIDAYVRHQMAELDKRLRLLMVEVAFAKPNQLPAAFASVMIVGIEYEMAQTMAEFAQKCLDMLENNLTQGGSK